MYAKFRCAPLRIKKALGIFKELRTTTTTTTETTRVAFWDPPSRSKKYPPCIKALAFAVKIENVLHQRQINGMMYYSL